MPGGDPQPAAEGVAERGGIDAPQRQHSRGDEHRDPRRLLRSPAARPVTGQRRGIAEEGRGPGEARGGEQDRGEPEQPRLAPSARPAAPAARSARGRAARPASCARRRSRSRRGSRSGSASTGSGRRPGSVGGGPGAARSCAEPGSSEVVIGPRDQLGVVGGDQHGAASAARLVQQVQHGASAAGIEPHGRLIEHQEGRLLGRGRRRSRRGAAPRRRGGRDGPGRGG